jgi:hypothetical protein
MTAIKSPGHVACMKAIRNASISAGKPQGKCVRWKWYVKFCAGLNWHTEKIQELSFMKIATSFHVSQKEGLLGG